MPHMAAAVYLRIMRNDSPRELCARVDTIAESALTTPIEAYTTFQREWAWLKTPAAQAIGLRQAEDDLRDPRSLAWVAMEDALFSGPRNWRHNTRVF